MVTDGVLQTKGSAVRGESMIITDQHIVRMIWKSSFLGVGLVFRMHCKARLTYGRFREVNLGGDVCLLRGGQTRRGGPEQRFSTDLHFTAGGGSGEHQQSTSVLGSLHVHLFGRLRNTLSVGKNHHPKWTPLQIGRSAFIVGI